MSLGDGFPDTKRANFFCNFNAVAVARTIIQNVLVRSCAKPQGGDKW
jgi:hypothetical protein